MKTSRFSDSQIIAVLKQAEGGTSVPELCRQHGISSVTFYTWRSKFGGMDASLMDGPTQGTAGREPTPEEAIRGGAAERRPAEGSTGKKMVRPSQRREMARWAVEGGRTSIRYACQTFAVSETCYCLH